jgi:hypothetical protein
MFSTIMLWILSMEFKYYLNFIYELILLSIGITLSTGSTSIQNGWYIHFDSCPPASKLTSSATVRKYHGQRRHTGCLCRRFSTAIGQARARTPRHAHRTEPVNQSNTREHWNRTAELQDKNSGIPFHSHRLRARPVCLSVNPWRITLHTSRWVKCTGQKPRHQPAVAPKNSAVRTMKRPITPATNPPESRPFASRFPG